jgi:4-amino-4-deoxy-L-arabinose transferase-like glycosyltransferase
MRLPQLQKKTTVDGLVVVYIILFFLSGVLTLRYFGLTWDESLGNLFFGERYLHYFLSPAEVHLDFKAELDYNRQHALNLFQSPFRIYPNEFPPVADTLAAASMYLFSYSLGWMNPIDAFHLFSVGLAAAFLWVFYRFAVRTVGRFAACMAVVLLSLFPRFWGDMHFNVKDVPETIFFGLVIFLYLAWLEKPTVWNALLMGIFAGLAVGIKANAIFIPLILLAGLVPWKLDRRLWQEVVLHFQQRFTAYLIMAATAVLVYIASWPYLYLDIFHNLLSYWRYIFSQGGRMTVAGFAFSIDPIRQVLFSMPEVMLAALLVGLFAAGARLQEARWRILLVWLIFPILRISLPGSVNFDGIRHFLEFLPAAALIAGLGLSTIAHWLSSRLPGAIAAKGLVVAVLAVNLGAVYLHYFPNLHLYYNQVSGGLYAARNGWLGAEAGDYWGASYRQGMEWLNQNAPAGSLVRGIPAEWTVSLSAPVFLRPDIEVIADEELPDLSRLQQAGRPIYLMYVMRDSNFLDEQELAFYQQHQAPVYEILVDRVPILQINRVEQLGIGHAQPID